MASDFGKSAPIKILVRLLLTMLLLYLMNTLLVQYFFLDGGLPAYIILGSLLTLMNIIARPILHILLIPLALFMGPILTIALNAFFLWLVERIVSQMDQSIITLQLTDAWFGWLLVAVILGVGNWVMKEVVK